MTQILHLFYYICLFTCCDSRVYMNVHASLQDVPQDIPINVTVVNLAGNMLVNLTAGCMGNLTQLEGLKLSNNHIENVEKEVSAISTPSLPIHYRTTCYYFVPHLVAVESSFVLKML